MSSYTHFTLDERKYLQQLLAEGKNFHECAAALGRNPSSISREVNRNKSKKPKNKSDNPYKYNHWRANTLAIIRRRNRKNFCLQPGTAEADYVITKLNQYWSPEQIANRWKMENPDKKGISTSTIYRAIKGKRLDGISRKTHLRRRGKLLMPRSSNYNTIRPERIIPEWPKEIVMRERIGDWEGDTVLGGIRKGGLVSLVDRKSRFLRVGLLGSKNANETKSVIVSQLRGIVVRSVSFDNGSEFAEFHQLEKEINAPVYFAEPHKPWQRGTNENTNDILRFFFPKGFDFHSITQVDVDFVVDLINNRPRKCLGWLTPAEVFFNSID